MTGSSNFLRFDPNLTDTITDNDYALNGQRLNGLQTGLAPTALHNKFYVQQSSMVAALGQVLAAQGFTVTDADYNGLVSALATVIGAAASAIYPKDYVTGLPPVYNASTSILLPAGLSKRSTDNTVTIEVSSDTIVNINASGANGLDVGVKSPNNWYYTYLIRKSIDGTVAGLFSLVDESTTGSITLPPGYDQKVQLPTIWRLKSDSTFLYQKCVAGWPTAPLWQFNETIQATGTTGPLTILSNGVATVYTTLSCASLMPPNSILGLFHLVFALGGGGQNRCNFRTTGFTNDGILLLGRDSETVYDRFDGLYETNNLQQVDYRLDPSGAGALAVYVRGYVIQGI